MATDDPKPKFFEVVPSGTHVAFLRHKNLYLGVSLLAVVLSLAALVVNYVQKGSALNFGIDFAGGSQVRLAFDEKAGVTVDGVRVALEELGYEGGSVVSVPDAASEMLLRVKEVVSVDEKQAARCEAAVQKVGDAALKSFVHPKEGSKIFLKFDRKPIYHDVEKALADAGCEGRADKGIGKPEEFPVEISLLGIGAKLKNQLEERFGAGSVVQIVRSETVGAKVGQDLKIDGIRSLLFAIAFIFLYVMFRFDLRFAPGGIIALIHDATIVVGAFAVTGREFNLITIAALLTIIGYSINDTIVVFDRIRERVALYRDASIEETTNAALNDTLSRTILTSATTLVVVVVTYLLGSGPILDFSFALVIGLVVGTYSSLYVATPIFLWINERFYAGKGHLKWLEEPKPGEAPPLLAATEDEIDEHTGKTFGELREGKDEGTDREGDDAASTEGGDRSDTGEAEGPEGGRRKASRRRRRPT